MQFVCCIIIKFGNFSVLYWFPISESESDIFFIFLTKFYLLWFYLYYPCEHVWVSLNMLPPTSEPHVGMYLGGNPFTWQHNGYMFSILMPGLGHFILSLGFCSQENYLPRDRKGYETFTVWLTRQPSSSFWFVQNPNENRHDQSIDWIRPLQPPV